MNGFKSLDLSRIADKIGTYTLNVHDFSMVTPTIAKVVLTTTGNEPDKDSIRLCISNLLGNSASVIDDSFRHLTRQGDLRSVVGFIKANREIKPLTDEEAKGMKVMASNLLMDPSDRSLWELKENASGKFIARQGNDELSELVHMATASRLGVPKIHELAFTASQPHEIAAYVNTVTEEMEHGVVIASKKNGSHEVLPVGSSATATVLPDQLVHVAHLESDEMPEGMTVAAVGGMGKDAVIQYWQKVYHYAPDYLAQKISQINEMSYA